MTPRVLLRLALAAHWDTIAFEEPSSPQALSLLPERGK